MNETPTPEADAAAYEATTRTVGKWIVPLAKARKLERERDEASDSYVNAVNQLAAERALADRLATTLKRWSNNDQANRDLAAWKEARK